MKGRENQRQALLRARKKLGLQALSLPRMLKDPFIAAHLHHAAFGTALPTLIKRLGLSPLKTLRASIKQAQIDAMNAAVTRKREALEVEVTSGSPAPPPAVVAP